MRGVVRPFHARFGAYSQAGQRLGGTEKIDADQAIQNTVALATRSDIVICIGGLTPEWESEGFDRPAPVRLADKMSSFQSLEKLIQIQWYAYKRYVY